ncbi:MAG: helix-turn-helix transcriptional regulator [Sphingomonadaceae bacterium]|nr:helix-turn-helix transcriptional regulator [Sphingomonadaceae bacterium]
MSEQAERLRQARINCGFATAKDAATAIGTLVSTYIHHENGTRGISASRAALYAKSFNVTEEWLLYGLGSAERGEEAAVLDFFRRIPDERKSEAIAILRILSGG